MCSMGHNPVMIATFLLTVIEDLMVVIIQIYPVRLHGTGILQ